MFDKQSVEKKKELDELIKKTCKKIEDAKKKDKQAKSMISKSEAMKKYYYDLRTCKNLYYKYYT